MIDDAVKAILSADAGVTALVSTRVFPGVLPQDVTYPAIAYRQVSENSDKILASPGTNGQYAARYRFFSVHQRRTTARQVDDALVSALTGYAGTIAGVVIQGIFQDAMATDDYDDTTETYQFARDFTVHAVR